MAEVKRIRRKLSRRLAKALKEGRFYQEPCKMDREADAALRIVSRRAPSRRKAR